MNSNIFLGFDTSNYTTSCAATDGNEYINIRKILDVKEGSRGLRQSDALFVHVKNMPELYKNLSSEISGSHISAVGVSTRPRSVEGSYMPVFRAGFLEASAVADTLGVPILQFSHQDGHIMAGIFSSGMELTDEKFISVHLSGGTTEILETSYNGYNFDCKLIGGTKDISAGQVTDRLGVAAGLKFPCGAALDKISLTASEKLSLPVCTDGGFFNFSGLETKATQLLKTHSLSDVAKGTFTAIAKTLCKSLQYCMSEIGTNKILIAGGVASNSTIRNFLNENIGDNLYFASPELSCDNAVGIALCAQNCKL